MARLWSMVSFCAVILTTVDASNCTQVLATTPVNVYSIQMSLDAACEVVNQTAVFNLCPTLFPFSSFTTNGSTSTSYQYLRLQNLSFFPTYCLGSLYGPIPMEFMDMAAGLC